jgi:hypothetical protein
MQESSVFALDHITFKMSYCTMIELQELLQQKDYSLIRKKGEQSSWLAADIISQFQ